MIFIFLLLIYVIYVLRKGLGHNIGHSSHLAGQRGQASFILFSAGPILMENRKNFNLVFFSVKLSFKVVKTIEALIIFSPTLGGQVYDQGHNRVDSLDAVMVCTKIEA
ncbi:MAG: hypothetical protein R6V54_05165 [Desulfobacteraceae bacterium]